MAIHIPLIFAVDVGHHLRVVTHHFEQIGGNITVEVMGKDLFSSLSCTRAPLEVIM